MSAQTLLVTRIQRFCTGDGPGIRTTVFLQGCSLRCAWCHNPETQALRPVLIWTPRDCAGCASCVSVCPTGARVIREADGGASLVYERELCSSCGACASVCPTGACELSAKEMTVEALVKALRRDADFFGAEGGVTLSGGEPLLQAGVLRLMDELQAAGISVAIETAGAVPGERMAEAAARGGLFLYDLKDTDAARFRGYVGGELARVLDNLRVCDENLPAGGRIRLRCIMVKGVNMDEGHARGIAAVCASLTHCEGVELIPYHAYAGSKAERVGLSDNGHKEWIPGKDELELFAAKLSTLGVPLFTP